MKLTHTSLKRSQPDQKKVKNKEIWINLMFGYTREKYMGGGDNFKTKTNILSILSTVFEHPFT